MEAVFGHDVDGIDLLSGKGDWGSFDRLVTTVVLSMVLTFFSLVISTVVSFSSTFGDLSWVPALTSNIRAWDCAALKGTPLAFDLLIRSPSVLVPAILCSWSQQLNMPQRLTRLFVLHCIWNLILGFLLIMAGVKFGSPF
jgi:hypothetical protein